MDERSPSRASGTTYHSFNDSELYEPPSPPRPPVTYDAKTLAQLEMLQHEQQRQILRQQQLLLQKQQQEENEQPPLQHHDHPTKEMRRSSSATRMQRQDSGYESISPARRSSTSNRPTPVRRSSNASSTGGNGTSSRPRTRPSIRRAARSHAAAVSTAFTTGARSSNQSLHLVRTSNSGSTPMTFFHFPSPDPPIQLAAPDPEPVERLAPTPAPSPPPQTTHYWTSDRTRRLEYAAIDAATRGVKGWILRHLVPDCFVPRENRHVSFDDDSGSVRRYRLELEDDMTERGVEKVNIAPAAAAEVPRRRRRGWRFWRRRKSETTEIDLGGQGMGAEAF